MTALHVAAQSGRADLVRHLLEKGANPEITDSNGRKAIDLVGAAAAAAGRGRGGAPTTPASATEIRALLETAASKK
jgi:hypothetical protein